jgi:hypothetical protein
VSLPLAGLAGEAFTRLAAGPPARLLFTGSFQDHQAGWRLSYGVDAHGRRVTSPAGGRPVAVLGDSFVFGQGVADEADCVSRLNQRGLGRRFDNLGLIGAGLHEYRIVARDLIRPDHREVVVLLSANDAGHAARRPSAAGRLAAEWSSMALLQRTWRALLVWNEHRRGGRPRSNVEEVLGRDHDYFRRNVDPAGPDAAAFDVDVDALLSSLHRSGGRRVVVAMAPDATLVSPAFRRFVEQHGGRVASPDGPGRALALAQASAARNGADYVDLYPALRACGSACYHERDLHWTEEGHRRAADLLASAFPR